MNARLIRAAVLDASFSALRLSQLCCLIFFRSTCCPYGGIPILPILVSFVLLVMTWVSAFACNLFEADRFTAGVTVGYGAWLVQGVTANTGGGIPTQFETLCFPYSSVGFFNANLNFLIDSNMQVARAFSMIAVVLSVPVFIMILMTGCCTTSNHTSYFRLTGGLAGFTGVCQLLTLVRVVTIACERALDDTLTSVYSRRLR